MPSEQEIEQEIQDKGLTAPRVTPEHVNATIKGEEYLYSSSGDRTLTICVLTLQNGFTVTGESACASKENYDRELGCSIAKDDAKYKIWLLEGYLFKEKLYRRN